MYVDSFLIKQCMVGLTNSLNEVQNIMESEDISFTASYEQFYLSVECSVCHQPEKTRRNW